MMPTHAEMSCTSSCTHTNHCTTCGDTVEQPMIVSIFHGTYDPNTTYFKNSLTWCLNQAHQPHFGVTEPGWFLLEAKVPKLSSRFIVLCTSPPYTPFLRNLVPIKPPMFCPGDEDFCGLVKRVCMGTRDPRTLESRVIDKVALVCGIEDFCRRHPELSPDRDLDSCRESLRLCRLSVPNCARDAESDMRGNWSWLVVLHTRLQNSHA